MTEPSYTDLAVAIGRLEEGQKNVLNGLDDIKGIARDAVERVTKVEMEHAVTRRDVEDLREELRSKNGRRPTVIAIVAVAVSVFAAVKQYLGL